MIHEEIRQARLDAGLSVTEVAQRAGVPRKQIHDLEKGANVTLETLRKIVPAIPNLKKVTLGGLEIVTANADLEEARRAALDLFDVAKRLIGALGAPPRETQPAAGAVRFEPGQVSERKKAEELDRLLDQPPRKKSKDTH